MMYSSANSKAPHSDSESPVASGGADSQMQRGDRQGRHGDVDNEGTERADAGSDSYTHILNGSSA